MFCNISYSLDKIIKDACLKLSQLSLISIKFINFTSVIFKGKHLLLFDFKCMETEVFTVCLPKLKGLWERKKYRKKKWEKKKKSP